MIGPIGPISLISPIGPMIKLEKFLFYLFLFLIPFQIRAFLYWQGNEWNSVFLYLGDVVFFGVMVLWLLRQKRIGPIGPIGLIGPIGIFLAIAGISLFFSSNLGIGIFRFIKLVEFVGVFLYAKTLHSPNRTNKTYKSYKTYTILIASGLFQALLAIAQFLKQSSLGLKFIEAGVYGPGMPGVATFIMENGEKVMRAYGSFPHPNVLAGFLLLSIFALYAKILSSRIRLIGPIGLIGLILIFALFLTFSRTAIGVFLVVSLVMFLFYIKIEADQRRSKRGLTQKKTMGVVKLFGLFAISCIISVVLLFPYLQARFFTISLEEEAIDLRFFYNKMAFAMIKEKPFLGIGIGNFVFHSQNYEAFLRAAEKMLETGGEVSRQSSGQLVPSWIYQPVHNIYLLIAVEMGILGLIVFIAILITNCIRMIRMTNPFLFLIIGFLILGLTDHYFWTLHSGGLIFWLALALARSE